MGEATPEMGNSQRQTAGKLLPCWSANSWTWSGHRVDSCCAINLVVLVRSLTGGEAAGLYLAARIVACWNAGARHRTLAEARHRIRDGSIIHHHAWMMRWVPKYYRTFLGHLFMHGCAAHRLGIVGRHGHGVRGHHSNCREYDNRLHGASFDPRQMAPEDDIFLH